MAVLSFCFPFNELPDSTDLLIRNDLETASIVNINLLLPNSMHLIPVALSSPVPPGTERIVTVPFSYISRIIFATDSSINYRSTDFAPVGLSATVTVSRASREFGGLFDVVMGTEAYVIINETSVPIAEVFLLDNGLSDQSIISSNPLLPNEIIFLWLDRDTVSLQAVDTEGNASDTIRAVRSDENNVFGITTFDFLSIPADAVTGSIYVINCINGEFIEEIEVYPLYQEPFLVDLSEEPLSLWKSVEIPSSGGIEFIVCIDSRGRTFSVNDPDLSTGAYIVDWWNLDFNFNFPDRR